MEVLGTEPGPSAGAHTLSHSSLQPPAALASSWPTRLDWPASEPRGHPLLTPQHWDPSICHPLRVLESGPRACATENSFSSSIIQYVFVFSFSFLLLCLRFPSLFFCLPFPVSRVLSVHLPLRLQPSPFCIFPHSFPQLSLLLPLALFFASFPLECIPSLFPSPWTHIGSHFPQETWSRHRCTDATSMSVLHDTELRLFFKQ